MKKLIAICVILAATARWAADTSAAPPATTPAVRGEVMEVMDVESYTYLRLKTNDGETWAAVRKAPVKKGEKVTIENITMMNNFESKALKKTFPTILFGTLGGEGSAVAAAPGPTSLHSGSSSMADAEKISVPKAAGANAYTVEEIVLRRAALKDKPVSVRGKIVKFTSDIMGKNWIHLRDGSGSASNNTNDLVVTTSSQAKAGDVVTVKGIARIDKDLGSGYFFKVLLEEATLQP